MIGRTDILPFNLSLYNDDGDFVASNLIIQGNFRPNVPGFKLEKIVIEKVLFSVYVLNTVNGYMNPDYQHKSVLMLDITGGSPDNRRITPIGGDIGYFINKLYFPEGYNACEVEATQGFDVYVETEVNNLPANLRLNLRGSIFGKMYVQR